jgi:hypothetical protein
MKFEASQGEFFPLSLMLFALGALASESGKPVIQPIFFLLGRK